MTYIAPHLCNKHGNCAPVIFHWFRWGGPSPLTKKKPAGHPGIFIYIYIYIDIQNWLPDFKISNKNCQTVLNIQILHIKCQFMQQHLHAYFLLE